MSHKGIAYYFVMQCLFVVVLLNSFSVRTIISTGNTVSGNLKAINLNGIHSYIKQNYN